MSWKVQVTPGRQSATPTAALAIDVDPQQRVVGLGLRRRSGGADLWGNRAARCFVDAPTADWDAAIVWLQSDEAAALLRAISGGYRASMAWSGDWVAEWTPEARDALRALQAAILERV